MEEFELNIRYRSKYHKLKAVFEYESAQIMRIRVHGNEKTILLENNYPLVQNGKKAMKWKLREGSFDVALKDGEILLTNIIEQLEYYIKGKHNRISQAEYLQKTKT